MAQGALQGALRGHNKPKGALEISISPFGLTRSDCRLAANRSQMAGLFVGKTNAVNHRDG